MHAHTIALVLAAGKGTRMKSARAKVLHEVFFRPMIHHVLDAVQMAKIDRCAVVVGHQSKEVLAALDGYAVTPVIQEEQLGTGHAVLCAESACRNADLVMILCGDTPLIQPETLQQMLAAHEQAQATLTLMSTILAQPFGYGRIISDAQGKVAAIVEEKDASEEQRRIQEINAGIYLAKRDFLFQALAQVDSNNSQGEIYLTDIVAIAIKQGLKVERFVHEQAIDTLGVNSRGELAKAHAVLQARRNEVLMRDGVSLYHPDSILVAPDCCIGKDSVLEGPIRISGASQIGEACHLSPGCVLHNCQIGDGAQIGANTVMENYQVKAGAKIAPLSYCRKA